MLLSHSFIVGGGTGGSRIKVEPWSESRAKVDETGATAMLLSHSFMVGAGAPRLLECWKGATGVTVATGAVGAVMLNAAKEGSWLGARAPWRGAAAVERFDMVSSRQCSYYPLKHWDLSHTHPLHNV